MGHPQERPTRDVHRLEETVAADVDHAPMKRFLREEGDRMQQKVELSPFLPYAFEHLLRLSFDHDIQRLEDRRFQSLRQRLDVLFGALVQIGHGEVGAERAKRLGAPPGHRPVVGDADDQAFFPSARPWYPGIRGS
jgi:hypothetical protein